MAGMEEDQEVELQGLLKIFNALSLVLLRMSKGSHSARRHGKSYTSGYARG